MQGDAKVHMSWAAQESWSKCSSKWRGAGQGPHTGLVDWSAQRWAAEMRISTLLPGHGTVSVRHGAPPRDEERCLVCGDGHGESTLEPAKFGLYALWPWALCSRALLQLRGLERFGKGRVQHEGVGVSEERSRQKRC